MSQAAVRPGDVAAMATPISTSQLSTMQPALRVAFQGERGAYGDEAAVRYFGPTAQPTPRPTFASVFHAVSSGEVDAGLVPIENSQAGSINEVYDLLRSAGLYVVGELGLPVRHCLLALPGQRREDIYRVISHPQALAQCDAYLRELGVEVVAEYDTAGSAKLIREGELRGVAAVASACAAELYDLAILDSDIQTIKENFTRFVAIQREPAAPTAPGVPARTMLLVATSHTAGSLYHALGVFASRSINLLKLESRPSRERPWEYVFYLDVEGAAHDPLLTAALDDLHASATFVQVLGSFPRGAGC